MPELISKAVSMWEVMRALWKVHRRLREAGDDSGAKVPQILEETLKISGRPLAYTTVATQLKMIEGKGLATTVKRGRNLYYTPTLEEPEAVDNEIEAFLGIVIHDDPHLLERLLERASRRLARARGPEKG